MYFPIGEHDGIALVENCSFFEISDSPLYVYSNPGSNSCVFSNLTFGSCGYPAFCYYTQAAYLTNVVMLPGNNLQIQITGQDILVVNNISSTNSYFPIMHLNSITYIYINNANANGTAGAITFNGGSYVEITNSLFYDIGYTPLTFSSK